MIERTNPDQRGKGYALEFGINHLKDDPPEVVIIFDADCHAEADSLAQIALKAHLAQRPIQAKYLIENPDNPSLRQKIAAFAFYVKNYVRPLGLYVLGLPCQLMGTGMAFPWKVIEKSDIGNGNIVEDMKLGIDLVSDGNGALFYPGAFVSSQFPSEEDAIKSQRRRWEHGHLHSIFSEALPLFFKGLMRFNIPMMMFAIDLAILPLSLLALTLIGVFMLGAVTVSTLGYGLYLFWSALLLCTFIFWSLVAWAIYGRKYLSLSELLAIPLYVFSKIPVYLGFFKGREKEWKRTERDE